MDIEVLYYFYNEEISVLEIKRTDLPDNSPKSKVYHWLMINNESAEVTTLVFKSMDSQVINGQEINVRQFENGVVRFDSSFAKFMYREEGSILMIGQQNEVSSLKLSAIKLHLKSS